METISLLAVHYNTPTILFCLSLFRVFTVIFSTDLFISFIQLRLKEEYKSA